uniref:Uncharacterized protein n=1 Tax=Echeneis naucrates TaxID=173247 RepID=A0A665TLE1_ECHNA
MFGQTFKNFSIDFNFLNERETFSSGDPISLEVEGNCSISSLYVQLKVKARVLWTEHYGKTVATFSNKEKYFIKQVIIQEIPDQSLPSSFKGSHGKIQYLLTAKLCRPMRSNSKVKTKFTLIHKGNPIGDRMLMVHTSTYKGTKVVAFIQNKLSRDIKPKYFLYKKISYFAEKKRVETKDILKEVGEAIPPSSSQTVTRIITIPPTTCVSILNCNIIRTQYRLRVYLDVKYATDPQIKFNIVILKKKAPHAKLKVAGSLKLCIVQLLYYW